MAKKSIAAAKNGTGKEYSKLITMKRSTKTGAYSFKEAMVHNDKIKEAIAESSSK